VAVPEVRGEDGGAMAAVRVVDETRAMMDGYLEKTFLKTASLMANACRAVAMLSSESGAERDAEDLDEGEAAGATALERRRAATAASFGEALGMAFQLVDDALDFAGDAEVMGKPAGASDLRSGVVTAPVIFAAAEDETVLEALGDVAAGGEAGEVAVKRVVEAVARSRGVEKTRGLARAYVEAAVAELVRELPPSEPRSALINLGNIVLAREK